MALIAAADPGGSTVLVSDIEFASNVFPWAAQPARRKVVEAPVEGLVGRIDGTIDVVAIGLVQSATGQVSDLAEVTPRLCGGRTRDHRRHAGRGLAAGGRPTDRRLRGRHVQVADDAAWCDVRLPVAALQASSSPAIRLERSGRRPYYGLGARLFEEA